MTVAIYIRVSTDEQAEHGYSIDNQKDRLIAYCASQGWDDFQLYIDEGYSGTNTNRPALKRLLRHIEQKKIHTVLVYKLDRLSRKQVDVLHLLEVDFEKNNVAFKSATEPFDTSTPLGKAMIGVLAVFAQLERDMIVERTTSGRRERVNQGKWYGGPIPFGYTWNKEAQMLEVVPEEAAILKEIFKQYLQGNSRLSIAEWAASRSKARTFDHNVIKDILSRPLYTGKLINSGSLVEGKHDRIIDDDTWWMVQREMDRRSGGAVPMGEYLLTGLLQCGVCNENIVHVKRITKRKDKKYEYHLYACKNQHIRAKDRHTNCSLGYKRRDAIEKYVINQIKEIALQPKKVQAYINQKTEAEPDYNIISSLHDKLIEINAGLENLYDAIQSGELKASSLSGRIKKLEEEREAIQNQIDDIEDTIPKFKDAKNVFYLIREIGEAWDYLDFEEQKAFIRKIVQKIVLNKGASPEIYWNIMQ